MPAKTNDQHASNEGDLNQELIEQMLSGAQGATAIEQESWSDDALQADRSTHGQAPTAVHPVQFMPLAADLPIHDPGHGIGLLMDVALEVSVELGRSHMSIGEILGLRTGSVIELDKLAGEPVDVSVNGTLIARGEVVVVDEKFGVRITEVVGKARRLASVA